jgi:hypothetical protein
VSSSPSLGKPGWFELGKFQVAVLNKEIGVISNSDSNFFQLSHSTIPGVLGQALEQYRFTTILWLSQAQRI